MHTVLNRDEFLNRYGNLFNVLYSGRSASKSSFRNDHWRFVMTTSKFLLDRLKFAALSRAIKAAGDEEIIITEIEPESPGHHMSLVMPCSYDDYMVTTDSGDLGFLPCMNTAIFGPSGSWAAINDPNFHCANGYTIFGGEDKIIDSWLKSRGGIDAARDDFINSWNLPKGALQLDPEVLRRLLADVGWE